MNGNDHRFVQLLVLEILKIFIAVCERNELRYYLTGGSLIGLLRHGGFIPWDDDIDIGMPRADYERLLSLPNGAWPQGYRIVNHRNDSSWLFAMSQLVDAETEVDIYTSEVPRRSHLWLDIFPLDGLPDGTLARYLHVKQILSLRYLVQIANIRTQVDSQRARPWYEKALLAIFKRFPMGRILDSESLLRRLEATLNRYDFDRQLWAGNMLGRYREREVVPKKYFGSPTPMLFEGVSVNTPHLHHELQTALYGDYMQLPPEHARVGHKLTIVRMRPITEAGGGSQ